LNLLPVKIVDLKAKKGPVEFKIDQFWSTDSNDVLIHGRLQQGIIKNGEKLKLGPSPLGNFIDCKVLSIKVNILLIKCYYKKSTYI
jgi:GTPase